MPVSLARKVKSTETEFCLTHCYTGYPMVRQARAMVQAGAIGAIRQLHLQYVQGYLASENVPPGWRLHPARIGGLMNPNRNIGTHAHHLGAYVMGLILKAYALTSGMSSLAVKWTITLRSFFGIRRRAWLHVGNNVASGAEHGLSFRIFGETGGSCSGIKKNRTDWCIANWTDLK